MQLHVKAEKTRKHKVCMVWTNIFREQKKAVRGIANTSCHNKPLDFRVIPFRVQSQPRCRMKSFTQRSLFVSVEGSDLIRSANEKRCGCTPFRLDVRLLCASRHCTALVRIGFCHMSSPFLSLSPPSYWCVVFMFPYLRRVCGVCFLWHVRVMLELHLSVSDFQANFSELVCELPLSLFQGPFTGRQNHDCSVHVPRKRSTSGHVETGHIELCPAVLCPTAIHNPQLSMVL